MIIINLKKKHGGICQSVAELIKVDKLHSLNSTVSGNPAHYYLLTLLNMFRVNV